MNDRLEASRSIARIKGFKHGASGQPVDSAYNNDNDYVLGWCEGRMALLKYEDNMEERHVPMCPPFAVQ